MRNLLYKYLSVVLLFLVFSPTALPAVREHKFVLVVDPGHGGRDAGAVGRFSKEKNINLKVALAFGKLVEDNCPDVKVIYTRKKDVFIPLQRRADIANENKADLFISIHTNALPKGRIAYGTETYTLGMGRAEENLEVAKRENSVITYESNYEEVYQGFNPNKVESYIIFELLQDKNMEQSVELARSIQQQYVQHAGRKNKGVHQGGLLVLRNTSMPAVLTELGFISTPAEEQYLNSEAGVRKLSRSLFNGFLNYRRKYDKHAGPLPEKIIEAEPEKPAQAAKEEMAEKTAVQTTAARTKTTAKVTAAPSQQPATQQTDGEVVRERVEAPPMPIFKVQLLVSSKPLKSNDRQFKGIRPVDCYQEKGLYKYTYGNTSHYQEIKKMHRQVSAKLSGTFIVAFLNGERIDLHRAIQLSKRK
ncbi:N-acetylmuramoyl-L-alanine amidase, family 3 [gut metagenome]|uniref:N-acetylmuramoyl-L-alanine amidase, family 3 n=1 Tax=gut metagenome TaxID=749906 RepID=J9FS81_9ZZZZ